jgi:hypothetical protein
MESIGFRHAVRIKRAKVSDGSFGREGGLRTDGVRRGELVP